MNDLSTCFTKTEGTSYSAALIQRTERWKGLQQVTPEIALLDMKLKQGSGIDALAEAKRRLPDVQGVIVTTGLTARDRKAAIDGAAGYLAKKATRVEDLSIIL